MGRKRTHTLVAKSRARSSRCGGLSSVVYHGWEGKKRGHTNWRKLLWRSASLTGKVNKINRQFRTQLPRRESTQRCLFWRTLFLCKNICHLEDRGLLGPLNELHLFALHYTYIPRINKCLEEFRNQWQNHPLSSEGNRSLHYSYIHLVCLRMTSLVMLEW